MFFLRSGRACACVAVLVVASLQSRAGWAGATIDGGRATGAKVALVIGNAAYDGADRLGSPANDAALIGRTFTQLGFETRIGTDLTRDEFNASVDWLATRARGAQVAIFYYAGHGFESGGDNFLVPVKTGIPIAAMTRATLLQRGIRFNAVRAQVKASRPDAFVALIDACRVPSRGRAGQSLKRDPAARGELIAYSTADQAAAYDSMRTFGQPVDNGPFAYYLSTYLAAPGATLKQALEHTQQQVSDVTQGQQRPWIASGLIGDLTIAQPGTAAARPAVAPPAQRGAVRGSGGEPVWPAATAPGSAAARAETDAQQQREDSWTDAEHRIEAAAQQADGASIRALRARSNDAAALTTLGRIAEGGFGTRRDPRAALAYYRRAAQMNYPIAQTLLGETYFEGKLVARDYGEAEKWLARAAAQDVVRAKLDLAQLRAARGQGSDAQNWSDALNLMLRDAGHRAGRAPAQ
ncbi:caspase family protein [Burkholderia sp. Ac-20349]|uniref:caspase family protein n=1 Tax=Burkholderia sp. Ac-20349 TaxID=2703893 RepID=UPI00197B220C|nr:caspase family protein [Burkholderia sp. Ac-20349]MBN3843669.1 hypothetical protein [Burkholderia sp. Ac-20349]